MEVMDVDNPEASTSALTEVIDPIEGSSSGTNDRLVSATETTIKIKADLHSPWFVHFLYV